VCWPLLTITEDKQKHETVVAKIDDYFKVRKNVIFERASFNHRNQLPEESAEEYVTTLYNLVENCEYGELTSQMIRDRLVVGIHDTVLSERLQMDATLTLDKSYANGTPKRSSTTASSIFKPNQQTIDHVQGRKLISLPTKSAKDK